MSARQSHEFEIQCCVFNWASLMSRKYPELRWLRGSMNGVRLTPAQAGKAKAAGMLKGEHDITLAVRRGKYAGISIELKYGNNKPTEAQIEYGEWLESQGWHVDYIWDDWTKAADLIKRYLEGKL